jgi:hypothetical protein
VTTDQRVVAKQEIQEVESAKRAGAPYAHHRDQAKDTNTKLRQQLTNAPRQYTNNKDLKILGNYAFKDLILCCFVSSLRAGTT